MADDRDRDAGGSGARRALPGEGTGMSGVEELAEQLAVAVRDAEHGRALVDRMFELPRGPEWEHALAELRAWSMAAWNA